MLIDTLGSGLFAPFELLYGHIVVGLSLSVTGGAIAFAATAAIATGPVAGALADRWAPASVVAAANGVGAAGAALLVVAPNLLLFAAAIFMLAVSTRMFWAAYSPLVASLAQPAELDRWFGRLRTIRYTGIAVGQGLASFALLGGQHLGLKIVAGVDAVSYLLAMLLTVSADATTTLDPSPASETSPSPVGYRAALRDAGNMALAVLNTACTITLDLSLLAMPVYVLETLKLGRWLPGALAAIGTGVVAGGALTIARLARGRPRLAVLASAAGLWTCGAAAFALAGKVSPWVAVVTLVTAMALIGAGEAAYAPTADAIPLALAPPGLAGRYAAVHQISWGISGAVAPLLAGALLEAGRYDTWVFLTCMAAATAACYAWTQQSIGPRAGRVGVNEA